MNLGSDHYVPVLKAKRGEKAALAAIDESLAPRITPLIEIVERTERSGKDVPAHLNTAFTGLRDAVRRYPSCFLDAREIAPDGSAAAAQVFERAAAEDISFVPVTGLSDRSDTGPALDHRGRGLALRLTRKEFEAGDLGSRVSRLVGDHGIEAGETDLIVDLGALDELITEGAIALTRAFLSAVPEPLAWRNLILSGSAFPLSMGVVKGSSATIVERAEWEAWREGCYRARDELDRLPVFSDCGIQHPVGVEGFDPRIMQTSAAIRYSLHEGWLLIKGVSTRRTPPGDQFPRLATQLVYGRLRDHFVGPTHCAGCDAIKRAADGAPKLGSAEVWRRLGTIHHITTVMEELTALHEP